MKRAVYYSTLYLLLTLSMISCDKKDGDWDPIKVDKSSFVLLVAGGEAVVNMKNYSSWWISDVAIIVDSKKEWLEQATFTELKNEWLDIRVLPQSPNQVYINLEPNTGEKREVVLTMTVGDTSITINVVQEKGNARYEYSILTEQNPLILPPEGGKFELLFGCKRKLYIDEEFIKEEYAPLKGLRYRMGTNCPVDYLTIEKNRDEVGYYKFTIEADGPYNMKAHPEWFVAFYREDANLITGPLPEPIFEQEFIHPQTEGEDYFVNPIISYGSGTFDF